MRDRAHNRRSTAPNQGTDLDAIRYALEIYSSDESLHACYREALERYQLLLLRLRYGYLDSRRPFPEPFPPMNLEEVLAHGEVRGSVNVVLGPVERSMRGMKAGGKLSDDLKMLQISLQRLVRDARQLLDADEVRARITRSASRPPSVDDRRPTRTGTDVDVPDAETLVVESLSIDPRLQTKVQELENHLDALKRQLPLYVAREKYRDAIKALESAKLKLTEVQTDAATALIGLREKMAIEWNYNPAAEPLASDAPREDQVVRSVLTSINKSLVAMLQNVCDIEPLLIESSTRFDPASMAVSHEREAPNTQMEGRILKVVKPGYRYHSKPEQIYLKALVEVYGQVARTSASE